MPLESSSGANRRLTVSQHPAFLSRPNTNVHSVKKLEAIRRCEPFVVNIYWRSRSLWQVVEGNIAQVPQLMRATPSQGRWPTIADRVSPTAADLSCPRPFPEIQTAWDSSPAFLHRSTRPCT